MRLLPARRRQEVPVPVERADPVISFQDWANMFYQGINYGPGVPTLAGNQEAIDQSFQGYVQQAYKRDGIVFACILVRQLLFAEVRFTFRQRVKGKPGDLFGTPDLGLLEVPWPNASTADLLSRMEQDASLAGNFFCVRRAGPTLRRLRPDWVTIVLDGEQGDPDSAVVGYLFHPGGRYSGRDPYTFDVKDVAHYMPVPDPEASYKGMSWLTPVLQEIRSDKAATDHKLKFFEKGATPSMIGKLNLTNQDAFDRWVKRFREDHEGEQNAYKTLWLAAGADVQVVGKDLRQLEFRATQGAGETRIAAAAGVPPVIAGFSEGLAAATYSNYGQARRRLADGTMRPMWRAAAQALQQLVPLPPGAELWYDDTDVAFIREDLKDQAEITFVQAQTIRQLVDGGFVPDTVVQAVVANDLTRLKHTDMFSVQLQPAGTVPQGKGSLLQGVVAPANAPANGGQTQPPKG